MWVYLYLQHRALALHCCPSTQPTLTMSVVFLAVNKQLEPEFKQTGSSPGSAEGGAGGCSEQGAAACNYGTSSVWHIYSEYRHSTWDPSFAGSDVTVALSDKSTYSMWGGGGTTCWHFGIGLHLNGPQTWLAKTFDEGDTQHSCLLFQ